MVRDGIKGFYRAKIEEAEGEIHEKTQNLRRLEAQRNALNAKGKRTLLRYGCILGSQLFSSLFFFFGILTTLLSSRAFYSLALVLSSSSLA